MKPIRPLPDTVLIARMEKDILAALDKTDGSIPDEELLRIASPEDCLHCHRLAHVALQRLVKRGLIE
jgi:hypothetical protein